MLYAQTYDTLGYNVAGGSYYGPANWKVGNGVNVVADTSGIVRRLEIYTHASVPATNQCQLSAYDNYVEGASLLGYGELNNVPTGQWNGVDVEFSIGAGDTVALFASMPASNIHGIAYNGGTGTYYQTAEGSITYANEPLNPLQAVSQQTGSISLRVIMEITAPVPSYTLTVASAGNGSTTPSGETEADSGVATLIAATADEDYLFDHWAVTSGTAAITDSTEASTTITLEDGAATVTAYFVLDPFRPKKIMPLGNSITLGYYTTDFQAYRCRLQDTLGIGQYNFVGPYLNGSAGYDSSHAGVSGNRIFQIRDSLFIWLPLYMNDTGDSLSYILCMAGTNDANNIVDTSQYNGFVDQYAEMIDSAKSYNPKIVFIAATVPPIDSTLCNDRAVLLNSKLRTMIEAKDDTVPGLLIAEVYDAVVALGDWQSLYADYLHPTEAVAPAIASAMAAAINTPLGPVISSHPVSVSIFIGRQCTLSVAATGTGTLAYQWYLGESPISGATDSIYTFTVATTGAYSCRVVDDLGTATSNTATITALVIPTISSISPVRLYTKGRYLTVPDSISVNGTVADTSAVTDSTAVVTATLKGNNLPDTVQVHTGSLSVSKIIKFLYKAGKLTLGVK